MIESIKKDKQELLRYNAYYAGDTNFASRARLLQSKWREQKGYPAGKLGNYLELEFAKSSKANFLTNNIKQQVIYAVASSKLTKALIGEPRIWNNLLSSQPLCFNLFGEVAANLELATNYFRLLFPDRIDEVTAIKFEHSPGRGDAKYTGDRSAFDVFVEYRNKGRSGFIGIEVKYAECLKEESKETAARCYKPQYGTITQESKLFIEGSLNSLKQPPLSQIWRDHLLSITTMQDFDEGFFVFLFPAQNRHCQEGVDYYKKMLISRDEAKTGFYPRHLDDFIMTLTTIENSSWTRELKSRYLG